MIKAKLGHRIDGWVRTLLPFLFRRRINPNLLSILGLLVSLAAAAMFPFGWFVAGGLLITIGGVFDLVDGVVARHHGLSTRFGAFLDSTVDRITDMALLLGLTFYFALAEEPGHVLLAAYTLAASVLVSYTQARAEQVVPGFRVGLFERGERIALLALGALSGFVVPALWVIAVGSTWTVVQRFTRAYQLMTEMDDAERVQVTETDDAERVQVTKDGRRRTRRGVPLI